MAWEGGGNAAVDGMLTIKESENAGIRCSTMTFEFGGKDGTEGDLLVDHVPEADAIISGGSSGDKKSRCQRSNMLVGGDVMRLNTRNQAVIFRRLKGSITFDTHTHIYCAGNQVRAWQTVCGRLLRTQENLCDCFYSGRRL
jgi:sarcosine reductase